jgi:hypothetical protein
VERRNDSRPGRNKPRLALSVVLGMALVPMSAVGAVLVTQHSPEIQSETETPVAAATVTPPTIAQIVYSDVEATSDDLAYACGEGGQRLITAESEGTISELEQAALDALREICESQGTPLPGKEAPPPIVETRTVVVEAASPPPQAPAAPGTTAPAAAETTVPKGDQENGDGEHESPPPAASSEATYMQVHDQAVAEIEHAEAVGGSLEKISEARRKLADAERLAADGNYQEATKQAYEAIGKAREAIGEDDE